MQSIKPIDPITLKNWIDNKEVIVLDVREPIEYQNAHIAGTENIPLSRVEIEVENLAAGKNKKIVMVCQAGVRSLSACNKLKQLDDRYDCFNLEGGINQWFMSGLPLVRQGDSNVA